MLKLGLIGCGKMGGALLRGVERALGASELSVTISDVVPAAVESLAKSLSCQVKPGSPAEVAAAADIVLLAVKPGDMKALCQDLAKVEGSRLYLSIAAGLKLADLESWLGANQRVIRSMPNTPALVGTGAAAFARGSAATEADAALAAKILSAVGTADEVAEKLLDAVTGLSGSGPAYVFEFAAALRDAGVAAGLTRAAAEKLAIETLLGSARLLARKQIEPEILRDQVTSPNGTTYAGLQRLKARDFRGLIKETVLAATARSKELSQGD
jgi:pyrroline-5-carboxylate reductase